MLLQSFTCNLLTGFQNSFIAGLGSKLATRVLS